MKNSIINSSQIFIDKNYDKVESRIRAFCADHSDGQILTEIVKYDKDSGEIIFKAHAVVDGIIRGTAHGMEEKVECNENINSYVESAENVAIGRCLAMMGYTPNLL